MSVPESARCRHRATWLVAGGHIEWCYECGAIRRLTTEAPNISIPLGKWARPTGRGGENPWEAWEEER